MKYAIACLIALYASQATAFSLQPSEVPAALRSQVTSKCVKVKTTWHTSVRLTITCYAADKTLKPVRIILDIDAARQLVASEIH